MDDWIVEEVKKVLPESDRQGRYFWRSFVERIDASLGGLDGPEGGNLFVRECIAAGCRAVPVVRRNSLWEQKAPPLSDKRERGVYELRIRLGLFFAGCLRHLVQGVGRLRVRAEGAEWYPVMDKGGVVSRLQGREQRQGGGYLDELGSGHRQGLLPDAVLLPVARGPDADTGGGGGSAELRATR